MNLSQIIGLTKDIDLSVFNLYGTVNEFNTALIGDDFALASELANYALLNSPTFTSPELGDAIANSLTFPASGTTAAQGITFGDANLYRSGTDTLTTDNNFVINGSMTANKTVITNYNLNTTSTTADQILGFASTTVYRTMELTIQGINTAQNKYHATKVFVMNNGSAATNTEFGTITLGGTVASYTVDYNNGYMRVLVTPTYASSTDFLISAILTKI